MRPILALVILLLGAASAAPEPEYSTFVPEYSRSDATRDGAGLIEIESSTKRADRLPVVALRPIPVAVEKLRPEITEPRLVLASASADVDADIVGSIGSPGSVGSVDTQSTDAPSSDTPSADTQSTDDSANHNQVSTDDLCKALFASAQDNDLPVPFFANLLWQESRLKADDVSKKGAQGIAQFMPEVAHEKGLSDPFDPMQAIPASARFLRELRMEFGNLGFVAAAYNAGAHRVIDWLERRSSLPRETRDYVVRVTGLSVEAWRSMAVKSDALTFVQHLPCRRLPNFANVEQQQAQRAEMQEAKLDQQKGYTLVAEASAKDDSLPAAPSKSARRHESARESTRSRQTRRESRNAGHEVKTAVRERHAVKEAKKESKPVAKREAEHATHGSHVKHRSV